MTTLDLVAELRLAIEAMANARNMDVVQRLLKSPYGRRKQCSYQKAWARLKTEEARVRGLYELLIGGGISHDLLADYWDDKMLVCRLMKRLSWKRPCGTCLMCKFVNPMEV